VTDETGKLVASLSSRAIRLLLTSPDAFERLHKPVLSGFGERTDYVACSFGDTLSSVILQLADKHQHRAFTVRSLHSHSSFVSLIASFV
jgi:hypothetical protein